jgi:hypothetical protein
LFRAAWLATGTSFEEMKKDFVGRCEEEFKKHVCAEHPRDTSN